MTICLKIYRSTLRKFNFLGAITFLSGVVIAASFYALIHMPQLRGPFVITFLSFFTIAASAYFISVLNLKRAHTPLLVIWGFAFLFRLLLLFTMPSLSDDIYRYIWDGHLINQGINPYSFPVNDPSLDSFQIPFRELVNHTWMASPYLPAAQLFFMMVTRLAPQSIIAFQVITTFLDLLTGWLIMDILGFLKLPRANVLIYLWNPLIAIEFAHSAHMDAWMLFLTMLSFWLIVRVYPGAPNGLRINYLSAAALAAATLTKGLMILLAPLYLRRWKFKSVILFITLFIIPCLLFASSAGFGWSGALDGSGVFGAFRIYLNQWNFNSSLYHWLETSLTGVRTSGAVPINDTTRVPIQIAKMISVILLISAVNLTALLAWRLDNPNRSSYRFRSITLLRLAVIPMGAYLITSTTVHPWYVAVVIPFLPFLMHSPNEETSYERFVWPFLYLSCAVVFSYLTYINPEEFHEFYWVRVIEYIPFYILLLWAVIASLKEKRESNHTKRDLSGKI
jgi:hypothetical protein